MKREQPTPTSPDRSFQRRMEERSERLKKTKGTRPLTNKNIISEVSQTTFDAADELDKLHRKWKAEQFHFHQQAESLEQRDETIVSSRCNVKGSREHATSIKSSAKSSHRRKAKSVEMKQSHDSECSRSRCPLHEPKHSSEVTAASTVWKEKQLDEFLERMILKLQNQNKSREKGRATKSEKRKKEKRKKLLSLLTEIKQKMSQATQENTKKEQQSAEKFAFSVLMNSPPLTTPFKFSSLSHVETSEDEIPLETSTSQNSSDLTPRSPEASSIRYERHPPKNNKGRGPSQMDESTGIPKEIVIEMQKLLSAQRHMDRSPKILGQNSVSRWRKASVLDAIPENESILFDESCCVGNGANERTRRGKKQYDTVDGGIVDRAIDFFCCGKISDFVSSSTKLGVPIRNPGHLSRKT